MSQQKVLKSIGPQEEIAINIIKNASGGELASILNGISEFTKCFNSDDEYSVDFRLTKVIANESE